MQNVEMKVEGDKLTITVDLKAKGTASKSGKSTVIASSQGNQPIPGKPDTFIGLNIYKK